MPNSRNKGANFERSTAIEIMRHFDEELGIRLTLKRDLEQYRAADHGDLIPDDPTFPFVLELKRYADGPIGGRDVWWDQVVKASKAVNKYPCLIYKYDRRPMRFVMEAQTVFSVYDVSQRQVPHAKVEMELPLFCWIARELWKP